MSKFTIGFWVEVEAKSYHEAYKMAEHIQDDLIEDVNYVEDAGYHDVEKLNEEIE